MKLVGKIAAITGGTAGLGRGIAESYLAEGAKVALFARNPDKGAAVLEELNVKDRAIFVAGDVMEQSDVEGFIDQTVSHFGTIDILVNNAGGEMECLFHLLGFAPRAQEHDPRQNGPDHQYGINGGQAWQAGFHRLHSGQTCRDRDDEKPGARSGRNRDYGQLHLPRPRGDGYHQEQWPRDRQSDGYGI